MATEYFQANVRAICGGQRAELVTHWRIIDPTETNEWELARQLIVALITDGGANNWCERLSDCMSVESFLSSITCKRVAPTGGNTAVNVFTPTAFVGEVAGELSPQQNAGCIIWSSFTDPQATGRNFIYGVAEASIVQGTPTDAYRTLIETLITKWIPGFSVSGGVFEPVIYDRVAKTGRLINNGYLSPIVGVQRRREVPV